MKMKSARPPENAVSGIVWMIEDDSNIVRLVQFKLEKAGWSLRSFSNIADFREALTQDSVQPPDVLVLDRNLPDGSGLALARELFSDTRFAMFSCLLLSASPRDSATPPGVRWLRKPFQPSELVEILLELKREARRTGVTGEVTPRGAGAEGDDPELAALKSEYRASFSAKRAALESAWKAGRIEELRGLAHQLAGSAGLYGYDEIQAEAAALEEALQDADGVSSDAVDRYHRLLKQFC